MRDRIVNRRELRLGRKQRQHPNHEQGEGRIDSCRDGRGPAQFGDARGDQQQKGKDVRDDLKEVGRVLVVGPGVFGSEHGFHGDHQSSGDGEEQRGGFSTRSSGETVLPGKDVEQHADGHDEHAEP